MLKNVKCARCVKCGKEYEATPNLTNCSCGGILDIIYDYDYIKKNLTKETLKSRPNTMWRYRELLPVEETTPDTPLRVGWSPLYEEPRLAKQLGLKKLWVKDDGQNPTASLKDRASAMAVAKAGEAGAKIIACSATGNAASSLAGNAAAAGLKTFIFVPERAPKGKVAQLMTFGANVIYYDIVRQTEQEEKFGYRFVDFDTLLKESDIYTIHCPLNEETRGMIGAEQFAQMKPTAMLINTARGPIVDETALIDALTTGKIATAGLDTYEREPLPKDHPLLTLDNVVASAHAGGNTKDNDINMVNYVYHNIVAFDRGEPLNTPGDIVNGEYLKK